MKIGNCGTIILALTALAAASCGKEALPKGTVTSKAIIPTVKEVTITKAEDTEALNALKLSGFKMEIIADEAYETGDAGKYGETRNVTWNASAWEMSPVAYWINDTDMSFWAYSNAVASSCDVTNPAAGASGMEAVYPKSGVLPDANTDLMFAYATKTHGSTDEHSKGDEKDKVSFTFRHAMSKLTFGPTVEGLASLDGYSLSRISLTGAKTGGKVTFNKTGYVWSELTGNSDFGVTDLSQVLLLVPQSGNSVSVQLEMTHATKPTILLSSSFAGHDLQAGTQYRCNLQISDGRELTVSLEVLPWDLELRNLEIKPAAVNSPLAYTSGTIVPSESKVFVKNGMPVTGTFRLVSPKGAKLLLALDGNLDAFEVSPKITFVGDAPVNFSIRPLVDDPKVDYMTNLHIYLINSDSSVTPLDELVMREGGVFKPYTIILPRQ